MFSNNLVQRIRREYGNKGHICYRLFCITFQKAYRSLSGEAILQDLETVVTIYDTSCKEMSAKMEFEG